MPDETKPAVPPPGAGGWVPTVAQKWALSILVGVLGAVGPVLAAKPLDVQAVVVAAVTGLALGLGTQLGISSAGPRTPGTPGTP